MKKVLALILICMASVAGAAGVITPHWSGAIIDNLVVKESPYVDVRAYGAACDGTTDDTDAFNAAIAAMPNPGKTLFIPPGTCRIRGSVRIDKHGITIAGSGRRSTLILFDPTADNTILFDFRYNPDTSSIGEVGMRDLRIYSTDTARSGKIAIRLYDVVESSGFTNVEVHQIHSTDWTAEAVRTQGREWVTFQSCLFTADIPVHVMEQVNPGGVDLDHFVFRDTGLGGMDLTQTQRSPHALFLIDNEVRLQNLRIEGASPWAMGTHGLYWGPATIDTASSYNLYANGIRWEQSTDPNGWFIFVSHSLQGLTLIGNTGGSYGNGVYLRTVHSATLIGNQIFAAGGTPGTANGIALDVDGTVRGLLLLNNYTTQGETFSHPGMSELFAMGFAGVGLPRFAFYEQQGTDNVNTLPFTRSDDTLYQTRQQYTMDNGATADLIFTGSGANRIGYYRVFATKSSDMSTVEGGTIMGTNAGATALIDNTANFTNTPTAGKLSLHQYSGAKYQLTNNLGYTIRVGVIADTVY